MKILKKSGALEEYSSEKIKSSLAAASDEANQPLNESDLRRIIASLHEVIEGKEVVATHHITIIITGILYTKGYYGVIDKYLTYVRKRV